MSLHIRLGVPTDRPAIKKINRLAWQAAYPHIFTHKEMRGLFNHALRQHGSWVMRRDQRLQTFVADRRGKVVGFIGLGSIKHTPDGEITTFYVHPDYQRQGIGQQLWDAALAYLREEDYPALWVWVLERATARHFYEAQGCNEKERGWYSVGNHSEIALGYWRQL